jgi:hypothetical protein
MPEAFTIRKRANDLFAKGAITRKQRRAIVERLPGSSGMWINDRELRERVLGGMPSHVITKMLNSPTGTPVDMTFTEGRVTRHAVGAAERR